MQGRCGAGRRGGTGGPAAALDPHSPTSCRGCLPSYLPLALPQHSTAMQRKGSKQAACGVEITCKIQADTPGQNGCSFREAPPITLFCCIEQSAIQSAAPEPLLGESRGVPRWLFPIVRSLYVEAAAVRFEAFFKRCVWRPCASGCTGGKRSAVSRLLLGVRLAQWGQWLWMVSLWIKVHSGGGRRRWRRAPVGSCRQPPAGTLPCPPVQGQPHAWRLALIAKCISYA
jgi:hypothetical protein